MTDTHKLNMFEYIGLFVDTTTLRDHRILVEKAQKRLNYIIDYLYKFLGEPEYHITVDNAFGIRSNNADRHGDDGHFDPDEHGATITLVHYANEYDVSEPFTRLEVKNIKISDYFIKLDTQILKEDFEEDLQKYILDNGSPEEIAQKREAAWRAEYDELRQRVKEILDPEEMRMVRFESYPEWKQKLGYI